MCNVKSFCCIKSEQDFGSLGWNRNSKFLGIFQSGAGMLSLICSQAEFKFFSLVIFFSILSRSLFS